MSGFLVRSLYTASTCDPNSRVASSAKADTKCNNNNNKNTTTSCSATNITSTLGWDETVCGTSGADLISSVNSAFGSSIPYIQAQVYTGGGCNADSVYFVYNLAVTGQCIYLQTVNPVDGYESGSYKVKYLKRK